MFTDDGFQNYRTRCVVPISLCQTSLGQKKTEVAIFESTTPVASLLSLLNPAITFTFDITPTVTTFTSGAPVNNGPNITLQPGVYSIEFVVRINNLVSDFTGTRLDTKLRLIPSEGRVLPIDVISSNGFLGAIGILSGTEIIYATTPVDIGFTVSLETSSAIAVWEISTQITRRIQIVKIGDITFV